MFEKGFAEGIGLDETGLTSEIVSWIEKVTDWLERMTVTLSCVGNGSSEMDSRRNNGTYPSSCDKRCLWECVTGR